MKQHASETTNRSLTWFDKIVQFYLTSPSQLEVGEATLATCKHLFHASQCSSETCEDETCDFFKYYLIPHVSTCAKQKCDIAGCEAARQLIQLCSPPSPPSSASPTPSPTSTTTNTTSARHVFSKAHRELLDYWVWNETWNPTEQESERLSACLQCTVKQVREYFKNFRRSDRQTDVKRIKVTNPATCGGNAEEIYLHVIQASSSTGCMHQIRCGGRNCERMRRIVQHYSSQNFPSKTLQTMCIREYLR